MTTKNGKGKFSCSHFPEGFKCSSGPISGSYVDSIEVWVGKDCVVEEEDFGAIMAIDLKGIWYAEQVEEAYFRLYLLPWSQVLGMKVHYAT